MELGWSHRGEVGVHTAPDDLTPTVCSINKYGVGKTLKSMHTQAAAQLCLGDTLSACSTSLQYKPAELTIAKCMQSNTSSAMCTPLHS